MDRDRLPDVDASIAVTRRDLFDLLLVGVATALVLSVVVTVRVPRPPGGNVVRALTSLDPLVYLVVAACLGVLFMAYQVLYLPQKR